MKVAKSRHGFASVVAYLPALIWGQSFENGENVHYNFPEPLLTSLKVLFDASYSPKSPNIQFLKKKPANSQIGEGDMKNFFHLKNEQLIIKIVAGSFYFLSTGNAACMSTVFAQNETNVNEKEPLGN